MGVWIKDISYFLIIVSIIRNLLPDNKWDKIFRFFMGALLIFIVIYPISKLDSLDDYFDKGFVEDIFDIDMAAVSTVSENSAFALTGEEYKKIVKFQVAQMAEGLEIQVKDVNVSIKIDETVSVERIVIIMDKQADTTKLRENIETTFCIDEENIIFEIKEM